jgi:L-ribulose-5-phosphate 3-epimerase
MIEGATLLERLERAAASGLDGIDVIVPGDLDVAELGDACASAGVEVANVLPIRSLQAPPSHPDPAVRAYGSEGLVLALRAACDLGASSVLVPSLLPAGVSSEQGYTNALAELRTVLLLAEELDVKLALEHVHDGFLPTSVELVRFVDELDSPAAAIHFDVGNALRIGDPARWIDELGERIFKVDLKDWSRDRGFDVGLGEGEADWPAVAAALARIGYDGWVSAELVGTHDPARLAETIDAVLRPG